MSKAAVISSPSHAGAAGTRAVRRRRSQPSSQCSAASTSSRAQQQRWGSDSQGHRMKRVTHHMQPPVAVPSTRPDPVARPSAPAPVQGLPRPSSSSPSSSSSSATRPAPAAAAAPSPSAHLHPRTSAPQHHHHQLHYSPSHLHHNLPSSTASSSVCTSSPSTSTSINSTTSITTPSMTYAAVVAPRPIRRSSLAPPPTTFTASASTSQPKRASPLAAVPEQENVSEETPAAEPKVETENGVPGEIPSIILPVGAPVRMGRARSNSFYGRAQHTVLALRRSPPPPSPPSPPSPTSPTSSASSSESDSDSSCTSEESACPAQKTATFAPTSVPAALARTAQRLDLTLRTSASSLIGRSVAACLGASGLQLDTRPAAAQPLCIAVSTSTTTTSAPASSPPLRPAPLLPASPERTQALRDSRCRLVAGLLLNRAARARQPAAAARAHRRAFWESAARAGPNGVRYASGLRAELVAVC